jgi:hypothetical protein
MDTGAGDGFAFLKDGHRDPRMRNANVHDSL